VTTGAAAGVAAGVDAGAATLGGVSDVEGLAQHLRCFRFNMEREESF
jgi:hypothetical protein